MKEDMFKTPEHDRVPGSGGAWFPAHVCGTLTTEGYDEGFTCATRATIGCMHRRFRVT